MNKRMMKLGVLEALLGAVLFSACAPEMSPDLALDQASDNWIGQNGFLSEWSHCNDAWDNDGNGLSDSADPACRIPGPIRDLSVAPFGHNFFPDVSMDIPGGPGWAGGFRNPDQMARWFRFLTEPDGNVAGIDLYGAGVNPEVVPFPAPLPMRIPLGTASQGNNNNLSIRDLHESYLDHNFLSPAAVVPPRAHPFVLSASKFVPIPPAYQSHGPLGIPGSFYRSQGPWGGNGSQGAIRPAATGNPDI